MLAKLDSTMREADEQVEGQEKIFWLNFLSILSINCRNFVYC